MSEDGYTVVKRIVPGAVNSEVVIQLPGGQEIISVITKASADGLGLAAGKKVFAIDHQRWLDGYLPVMNYQATVTVYRLDAAPGK